MSVVKAHGNCTQQQSVRADMRKACHSDGIFRGERERGRGGGGQEREETHGEREMGREREECVWLLLSSACASVSLFHLLPPPLPPHTHTHTSSLFLLCAPLHCFPPLPCSARHLSLGPPPFPLLSLSLSVLARGPVPVARCISSLRLACFFFPCLEPLPSSVASSPSWASSLSCLLVVAAGQRWNVG